MHTKIQLDFAPLLFKDTVVSLLTKYTFENTTFVA